MDGTVTLVMTRTLPSFGSSALTCSSGPVQLSVPGASPGQRRMTSTVSRDFAGAHAATTKEARQDQYVQPGS